MVLKNHVFVGFIDFVIIAYLTAKILQALLYHLVLHVLVHGKAKKNPRVAETEAQGLRCLSDGEMK
jgi:hypothetical protein